MSKPRNRDNKPTTPPTTVKSFDEYDFAHLGYNQPTQAQFAYCFSEARRANLTEDDATTCICCQEEWTFDGKVTATRLACDHLMCRNCIPQWFGRPKKTCPTCRTVLMTCEEALEEPNIQPDEEDENLDYDDDSDVGIFLNGVELAFRRSDDDEHEDGAVSGLRVLLDGLATWIKETTGDNSDMARSMSEVPSELARKEQEECEKIDLEDEAQNPPSR